MQSINTIIRPFLWLALLALTITACDNSEEPAQEEKQPQQQGPVVGFSATFAEQDQQAASRLTGDEEVAASRTTRAGEDPQPGDGELTTELLQEEGFGVYCWYTGSTEYTMGSSIKAVTNIVLMYNQRVEYKNSQWTYTPSKYWPLNAAELLTFRAYAPFVSYDLQTDANGMPLLPVVVKNTDYHNGIQHDPLWGTSKHDVVAADDEEETKYGTLYNNYTWAMSGDYKTDPAGGDSRNGIIDWYFHHGMTKIMFKCGLLQDPGCDSVTIKKIEITPLYDKGLLSLNSELGDAVDSENKNRPTWTDRDGGIKVTLQGKGVDYTPSDFAPNPEPETPDPKYSAYPFVLKSSNSEPVYTDLLRKGLLIIPRDYRSTPMTITITYTVDNEDDEMEAVGTINDREFYGNTAYTMYLKLTPSTKGLEITLVQSAFTPWSTTVEGNHEVYNW